MAKTYGTVTTFTAGSVLTAAQLNVASTAVNNLVVPASAQVVRTSNLTPYTSGSAITWSSATWDSDSTTPMFSAGSPTILTVQTAGIYLLTTFVQLNATATLTSVNLDIYKNGALWFRNIIGNSTTSAYGNASLIVNCIVGDYFDVRMAITGGSAYQIVGNATETNNQSRFAMMWIGRTS